MGLGFGGWVIEFLSMQKYFLTFWSYLVGWSKVSLLMVWLIYGIVSYKWIYSAASWEECIK